MNDTADSGQTQGASLPIQWEKVFVGLSDSGSLKSPHNERPPRVRGWRVLVENRVCTQTRLCSFHQQAAEG
jgi:hypothetical protein